MATITKFEDLEIWQLARQQAFDIYILYKQEPFKSDFELRNQINAASGSVMDNIAEGFDRSGNKELSNFLIIAKGSNAETRYSCDRVSAFDPFAMIKKFESSLLPERSNPSAILSITEPLAAFI